MSGSFGPFVLFRRHIHEPDDHTPQELDRQLPRTRTGKRRLSAASFIPEPATDTRSLGFLALGISCRNAPEHLWEPDPLF